MSSPDRESLIEAVLSAHRERDPRGKIEDSPAFFDLEPEDRVRAFEETFALRRIESTLDPDGHSGTVRAVLAALARRA